MKIVILDAATLGADLDLSPLFACGEVSVFENTGAGAFCARAWNLQRRATPPIDKSAKKVYTVKKWSPEDRAP